MDHILAEVEFPQAKVLLWAAGRLLLVSAISPKCVVVESRLGRSVSSLHRTRIRKY